RYIIEALVDRDAGQRADKTGGNDNDLSPSYIFRITAVGWGPYGSAPVMLQSYYRKGDKVDG
ncbi:pilus assembly protein, partial [Ralstonia solanacearum]